MRKQGIDVIVEEVGLLVSKEKPFLGASIDRIVTFNPFTTDGRFSDQVENVPFHRWPVNRPNKALHFQGLDLVNHYLEGV